MVIHGKEKWFMWGKKVRGRKRMGDTWELLQVILKIVLKKLFFYL